MGIQVLKAKANTEELLAAYTEWYGDKDDEGWCYLSITIRDNTDEEKNLFFLFADFGSHLFQLDNTATAITGKYKQSLNDDDEYTWEPTSSIEEPELMREHTVLFGDLSQHMKSSSYLCSEKVSKDDQAATSAREYLECKNYIWKGGPSSPTEIWKSPKNNDVFEVDDMLVKISEATGTTVLPLRKLEEINEDLDSTEEASTHEIFLAYRDKQSSFEEQDLLWLIITTERPGTEDLYALVRSSIIGKAQQIDRLIKYTKEGSKILVSDSTGEPWAKQLEISDKTKEFTELSIDTNETWEVEDTNALEELNRLCGSYMENVYNEDKESYFKPRINKLSTLEQADADIGDSGDHQIIKLATPGFDDEILANLIECEEILL